MSQKNLIQKNNEELKKELDLERTAHLTDNQKRREELDADTKAKLEASDAKEQKLITDAKAASEEMLKIKEKLIQLEADLKIANSQLQNERDASAAQKELAEAFKKNILKLQPTVDVALPQLVFSFNHVIKNIQDYLLESSDYEPTKGRIHFRKAFETLKNEHLNLWADHALSSLN